MKARNSLQIFATPFKSSFLSISPSPFSPRTPLTPPLPDRQRAQKPDRQTLSTYPASQHEAPSSPLAWMWKCHKCHHSYRLGVTRRCLEDGHHFCSGSTTMKSWRKSNSSRKQRNHRACPSEFDYEGWKTIGRWRRGGPKRSARTHTGTAVNGSDKIRERQDCWNTCDYPSECRWGKKFGIHTPVEFVFPSVEVNNSMPTLTAPINTLPEGILKPGDGSSSLATSRKGAKTNLWTALLASAERRKSAGERGGSLLSTVEERSEKEGGADVTSATRDSDGDVIMGTIDPALLDYASSPLSPSSLQSASSSSSAVDSLKALVSRRRYRRVKSRSRMNGSVDKRHAEVGHAVMGNVKERMQDRVSLDEEDMVVEGFAPLCRVRSRGCSV
ncbi:hypothetical protein BKA58DRAFT_395080 [Alternaria rosae]|uniref:uncharacterized protein n=1 Tax=Alternaria rosae TaxID=1187941 RepID=UPI001E8EDD6B|nr:uncharacterized protein BKA58DRAFT_395080 [Alternaria rosae]KAH6851502.1 hypothetical protein BKA58DRAFT_395080 [Alternaria rosae]